MSDKKSDRLKMHVLNSLNPMLDDAIDFQFGMSAKTRACNIEAGVNGDVRL